MTLTLTAVYDGSVFRPRQPVELPPETECTLTIETANGSAASGRSEIYALSEIAAMAVDMGITDLADRHHEYAHPRRSLK